MSDLRFTSLVNDAVILHKTAAVARGQARSRGQLKIYTAQGWVSKSGEAVPTDAQITVKFTIASQ